MLLALEKGLERHGLGTHRKGCSQPCDDEGVDGQVSLDELDFVSELVNEVNQRTSTRPIRGTPGVSELGRRVTSLGFWGPHPRAEA
eukprot:140129-Prorocentrum_minimum.AAC.1